MHQSQGQISGNRLARINELCLNENDETIYMTIGGESNSGETEDKGKDTKKSRNLERF